MSTSGGGSRERAVQRRRFLTAIAAAGAAGMAGCLGEGSGGDGPRETDRTGGGGASGSDGPGMGTPFVSGDTESFLLPAGQVDSTFDVDLTPDTVLIEDEALAAVADFDLDTHRYTFDTARLQSAGIDLEAGSVLWISGLALRRVSSVTEKGSTLVVDTEFAALNEAISDGTVAWDAPLGFGEQYTNSVFDGGGEGSNAEALGVSNTMDVDASFGDATVALADVAVTDESGAVMDRPTVRHLQADGREVLQLEFTQGNTDYVFGLTPMGDEVKLKVEMTAPSGQAATMRFTGIGTAKAVRATGRVDYRDGELSAMDVDANQLEGEIKLDIAAAGTGKEDVTEIPFPGGFMFKHVFMAGAIPLTVTTSVDLKASINVVAKASATASSTFSFGGETGFSYDGTEVTPKANLGTLAINPESADSGAYFGQPVHAGFGVAFPKVSISVFDQLLIPYLKVGMAVNTSLTWGPVCKEAYLQLIVTAGYDLKILGVKLATYEMTLAEETREGTQEGCE